jgi:drug/metabolite transporter (DMT)-like permease
VKYRLLVLAAALLWSSGGAAIKRCGLDAWQLAGGRSLVAAVVLVALVPATRRRPTGLSLATGVAFAFTVVFFVLATKLTTAANAIFIQDTAPLWVLLLSPWLLHERPTRGELLSVPVFALGLGLFFLDRLTPGQFAGNLVAAGSGLAFALSILGLRRLGEGGPASLVLGNLMAAAATAPLWALGPVPTALDLGLVLFLGVFQLGLSYLLFTRGLRGTPAVEASLLVLLEPVLNPVWTYLFTGERPGPWALVGGAIILGATVWRTAQPHLLARQVRRAGRP